jgi:hypothetical protein
MSGERIRSLKPEWLDDQKIASASDTARLLSISLILLSDDHGRGRAHSMFLASRVWPYSSRSPRETLATLSGGLQELCNIGFLRLYQVDGQDYFEVRNWRKHQRVDKPSKPRVPEPLESDSGDPRETLAPDLDLRSGPGSPTPDHGSDARAPRSAKPKPWRRFPLDYEPGEAERALASELLVDVDHELAAIQDHEFAKPKTDPAATFRTWIRNAAKFAGGGRAAQAPKKIKLLTHAEHARDAAAQELPDWAKG